MTAPISTDEIIETYDALLIDAYGVLVHSEGPFPGAASFLERLEETGTDYLIVTNDASRLPETCAKRYGRAGISVDADHILTSAMLIVPHLREIGLEGEPVTVLGTNDSCAYLREAGYELVAPGDDETRAVIIGDEAGYDFVPTIEKTLSMLVRALDDDRPVELVCPNPDRLYPSGPDSVGFTAGAIATLIEDALRSRYPERTIEFSRLGKPHPALFKQAVDRLETDNVAMLGDQLGTDIRGANAVGLDSILVTGGISDARADFEDPATRPTRILSSLQN